MALSYCSNWEALQHPDSDINCSFPQRLQTEPVLCFDNGFLLSDTCSDPLSDPHASLYPNDYTTLMPFSAPPAADPVTTFNREPFLLQEPEPYNQLKCQLPCNYKEFELDNLLCGHYIPPNPCMLQNFPVPEVQLLPPLPEFQSASLVNYTTESSACTVKKPNGGSLSAQSIAARSRRRKITEKTQELGKLVPGGQKMNTAEMFQAASKYVKFLQAQVWIIEFMGSYYHDQETEEPFHTEELHDLLESPLVAEKLYSTEKCLVPRKFVEALASDHGIQQKHEVLKELKQLI